MNISSLLQRDFSDLTRPELIARVKRLETLRVRVAYMITLIGVLRYSRLPMTWYAQLKEGVSRPERLRSSPLCQMTGEPDAPWEYADDCLRKEIQLIHSALSRRPPDPFAHDFSGKQR